MMWRRLLKMAIPAVAAIAVCGSGGVANAATRVLILVDNSGSMADPGPCGDIKAKCAINDVISKVQTTYTVGDEIFTLWMFSRGPTNDPTTDIFMPPTGSLGPGCPISPAVNFDYTGGNACVVQALNFLHDNAAPGGDTPLPNAYCRAVSYLGAKASLGDDLHIELVSDGERHNIFGVDPAPTCDGPDTVNKPGNGVFPAITATSQYFVTQGGAPNFDYFVNNPQNTDSGGILIPNIPLLDVESWQANMFDVAITGGVAPAGTPATTAVNIGLPNFFSHLPSPLAPPHTPGFGDFPTHDVAFVAVPSGAPIPVLSVDFMPLVVPLGMALLRSSGNERASFAPAFAASAALAAAVTTPSDFVLFLDGLARSTGGRLTISGNSSAAGDPFGTHLVLGDINDDGCVDQTDVALVAASFGQSAVPGVSSAAVLAADVNLDGTVNDRDYATIKQQYGTGCTTPPSPPAAAPIGPVIFGFGDAANWLPVSTPAVPRTLTTVHTEGAAGLKIGPVANQPYREFKSIPFSTQAVQSVSPTDRSRMSVDLFIPTASNQFYLGAIQLYLDCASCTTFGRHQFIGNLMLTGKPQNAFSKGLTFNLPSGVLTALKQSHADFVIDLVVNSPDSGHVFDNIRFF